MAEKPARAIDAEYRDGALRVPADVQAEWNARGVTHVRIAMELADDENGKRESRVVHVQQMEREIVRAMLAAAGRLADTGFAERVERGRA